MSLRLILVSCLLLTTFCFNACRSNSASGPSNLISAVTGQSAKKVHFKPYTVIDQTQGGMAVSNVMVPDGWNSTSYAHWNFNNIYIPVQVGMRTEAQDGSKWIEFYPTKLFLWFDNMYDRNVQGTSDGAVVHFSNARLPQALARYVILPSRRDVQNLRILGYRPVNDLPKVFASVLQGASLPANGEGICMRVSYQKNGVPYDEEFYAYMPPTEQIFTPDHGAYELHRPMYLVHSIGAKAGTLEDTRSLLGFVATSIRPNPAWQQRVQEVYQILAQRFVNNFNSNMASIRAAGERSRQISQQNDEFLRNIDSSLSSSRTSSGSTSTSSSGSFASTTDAFDQYVRDTEHMQDQYGQTTDVSNQYSYHWATGFGDYVHSNDPNFNPNDYSNQNYERMNAPN